MKLYLTLLAVCLSIGLPLSADCTPSDFASVRQHERLRIAYVIDSYDQQKSGGIISASRFIGELKLHHDVTIVATGVDDDGKLSMRSFYLPFLKNTMKRNGFRFGMPDHAKLAELFKTVDLVYVHLPFYLGIKAVKIAKDMGKPVVVGFHLQPENLLLNVGIRSKAATKQLYRLFIDKFYNLADLVICPSPFAENLLRSHKNFTAKTVTISNGLTKKFRPRQLAKFPQYEDKFVLLTVGRLAREKRHDVIMAAVKKSKYADHIQLVITGDGALKPELITLGRTLPNPPQIGFVSEEDLIRLYNTADLYVHASAIELEGMSVLEAIGCGLPAVIADSHESASKQFALGPNFLFKEGEVDELAARIDYWVEHRAELAAAKAAYAHEAEAFYFETSVEKMLAVMDETLRASRLDQRETIQEAAE